jgi:hypothetical protein
MVNRIRKQSAFTLSSEATSILNRLSAGNKSYLIEKLIIEEYERQEARFIYWRYSDVTGVGYEILNMPFSLELLNWGWRKLDTSCPYYAQIVAQKQAQAS